MSSINTCLNCSIESGLPDSAVHFYDGRRSSLLLHHPGSCLSVSCSEWFFDLWATSGNVYAGSASLDLIKAENPQRLSFHWLVKQKKQAETHQRFGLAIIVCFSSITFRSRFLPRTPLWYPHCWILWSRPLERHIPLSFSYSFLLSSAPFG